MTKLEQSRKTWQGKSDEWLFERLANELTQKVEEIHKLLAENEQLRLCGVSVSLPNTEQAESFLIECDLYPHTNQSLKVMTEDGEGAYLDKKDIAKLIECLTVYIGNER